MNIEELNKLIQEELAAYLNENEEEVEGDEAPEGDDDDIEVTTDEPAEEEDALDTLRQIYDMLKPIVEPEGGEEPEMDMDMGDEEEPADEEPADEPAGEEGEEEEVEEAVISESVARFKKLANLKG